MLDHGDAPGDRERGRRACLATIDYTLAKRALLSSVQTGLTSWTDVCDAHPELIRAAKHVGEQTRRDCPVCRKDKLRLVTYVYGDGLRHDNGRVWPLDVGLSMAADRRIVVLRGRGVHDLPVEPPARSLRRPRRLIRRPCHGNSTDVSAGRAG